jgi:hypothetical protein
MPPKLNARIVEEGTDPYDPWCGALAPACDLMLAGVRSRRYSLDSAHRRSVARHARAIRQLEFGLCALHRWSKLGVWDAAFETLASLGPIVAKRFCASERARLIQD